MESLCYVKAEGEDVTMMTVLASSAKTIDFLIIPDINRGINSDGATCSLSYNSFRYL